MRSRSATVATLAVVTVLAAILVVVNVLADEVARGPITGPSPTATASASRGEREAARLATMAPDEIAAEGVEARPPVAPPGARDLADAAEEAALQQPFSFHVTTFNVLGSQHSAAGGAASGVRRGHDPHRLGGRAAGGVRLRRRGLQRAPDRPVRRPGGRLAGLRLLSRHDARRQAGVPTNLMWRDACGSRPGRPRRHPVHGRHPADARRTPAPPRDGREIYVMNVHNSPRDARAARWSVTGRGHRDRRHQGPAAGQPAGVRDGRLQRARRGLLQDHGATTSTLRAAVSNQGDNCKPPAQMRVDWIFGSSDGAFSGFLIDTSPRSAGSPTTRCSAPPSTSRHPPR